MHVGKWTERRGDPLWYEITDNELRAYLGVNIFMGINELPVQGWMPLHLS